jgi:hypothetical protein
MARYVVCDLCGSVRGVLFEREIPQGTSLDFLPHEDCAHLTRVQLVTDLDALYEGESSLPVSLKASSASIRESIVPTAMLPEFP